jgi:hypothetical protein
MRALLVFESMFGDTKEIADAIVSGLRGDIIVDVVEVGEAPAAISPTVDLLIVGGPTHAFGMSRPSTREDAVRQAAGARVISPGVGLREWLEALTMRPGLAAATFDTRMSSPRLPGSAAHAAERRLRRLGCRIIAPAESFFVTGTKGPLRDGELVRARAWATQFTAAIEHSIGSRNGHGAPHGS